MQNNEKSRYWTAVTYPENMRDDWRDECDALLQRPFAYCIHDKDNDKKDQERKTHVHWIVCFAGPTTYKRVLSIFDTLSKDGAHCLNRVEPVGDMRYCYDYLIHDTKNARKKGKHLYDVSERVTGNNFDIGDYEQLSMSEKNDMLQEILDFVVDNEILDMRDFHLGFTRQFDARYFEVYKVNNAMIDRLIRGNYNNRQRRAKESKERCCVCGTRHDLQHIEYPNERTVCVCDKHVSLMRSLIDEQMAAGMFFDLTELEG